MKNIYRNVSEGYEIEVRVNGDYGTVRLPESGEVRLVKNSTHLLRRSEVDHLIKRGMLSEIV